MKVQEVARRLGVTPRAVRFYEEKGLVHPRKAAGNGYRLYTEDDVERLRWVVALRELGLPLASIADVLDARSQTAGQTSLLARLDVARAELYAQWRSATQALEAFDAAVTRLQHGEEELQLLENAAVKLHDLRLLRESWQDRWQFDGLAAVHAEDAALIYWSQRLNRAEYNQALQRAVEWLDPSDGEQGLDLAAGTGNLTALLVNEGTAVTAVEQSANMLSVYRDRFSAADAKQGNLLALPLTEAVYSYAGCTFAFHYLEHAQQIAALEEIDRVLLSGGRYVMTGLAKEHLAAPQQQETSAMDRQQAQVEQRPNEPDQLFEIDYAALTAWLNKRGYHVILEQVSGVVTLLCAIKP
ncbi:MerR family transcriptional regulator [Paenibacillus kobensis]|uniref:MerR family transcriptional regulator n=1 Tax=Paenibacillus kobensis TaxID=59841 RepID=UPI000FD7BE93|nr:MerR family transcriptional regulator [Paenibacillus kobensis]